MDIELERNNGEEKEFGEIPRKESGKERELVRRMTEKGIYRKKDARKMLKKRGK